MADRRDEDDQRRGRGGGRDPEAERRIDRQADRYRGSDERGSREALPVHGERRFRDSGRDRDVVRYADLERAGRGDSPSGAFHDREGPSRDHSRLAGLHDMEDSSELRERYREHVRQRDYQPRYGHGPGVENMDAQRSDERIREDICDGLMLSWMNAENVDVQVRNGEVTLQGTVRSRDEKRAIEALAESVLGVKDLINSIRIERREQPRGEARNAEQTSTPADESLHS